MLIPSESSQAASLVTKRYSSTPWISAYIFKSFPLYAYVSFKFLPMIDSTYPIILAAEELRYAAQAVDVLLGHFGSKALDI